MISKKIILHFPNRMVDQPIIYLLSKEYDLVFNILLARIMPNEKGVMVAELSGEKENYDRGVEYLKRQGVIVQLLSKGVRRDDQRCTQCGICTSVCPTGALSIPDRKTMEVTFDVEKCVACSLCVDICPSKAMHVALNKSGELVLDELI